MRRTRRIKKRQSIENINITPLVDTLFVLLIVFMIPSQLIFGGVDITLPEGQAEVIVVKQDPLRVYIRSDGTILLDEEEVKLAQLAERAKVLSLGSNDIKIYILGDKRNSYGRIIQVVGALNTAGFKDTILVTDMSDKLE